MSGAHADELSRRLLGRRFDELDEVQRHVVELIMIDQPSGTPPTLQVDDRTLGQRVADAVATTMGSWRFIIAQTVILSIWVALNVTAFVRHWDPYPFILLNLALSFQAAYAGPILQMTQNRQEHIERLAAQHDHIVNLRAELEIRMVREEIRQLAGDLTRSGMLAPS